MKTDSIVYLRLKNRIQVLPQAQITLKEIATIITAEPFQRTMEDMLIYQVSEQDRNIIVIDGIKIIDLVAKLHPQMEVQLIGPQQVIVQVMYKKAKVSAPLFLIVWFLLFIGSGVTIMNFHEDVSMQEVHQKLFYLLTGIPDKKPLLFQIPYSIGLGLGMILFFNHVFKKRINEEPSPLEVEIFSYQQAMDQYIIMHENKESQKKVDGS
ncbi:stage V sporulation protein AA [Bacillus kwashiorkori]|uniref:stage V sporulation protein AA n=1 Tax=Bacillus kwashiorkori TaxID=1522318 RepID=UPI0007835662|nr:stage V sporulation protein AA [Bacillus kwashiorkori]